MNGLNSDLSILLSHSTSTQLCLAEHGCRGRHCSEIPLTVVTVLLADGLRHMCSSDPVRPGAVSVFGGHGQDHFI